MKTSKIFLCILIALVLIYLPQDSSAQTKAKQGISGEVILKEGNHMPGPGIGSGTTKKVSREIVVYQLVNKKDLEEKDGTFFDKIKAKKVASIKSGKNGKYYIRLAPGKYSVFVIEKGRRYANRFDGDGNVNPVEVKKNAVTTLNLILDYNAAY